MAFLDSIFGSSGQLKQLDRFNPQQQNVQNQALGQFGPLLQQLQKPADINSILDQRRQNDLVHLVVVVSALVHSKMR
jgi:hypothetical protein